MANQTVRELITVWGFDVRDKPLENLSTQLKLLKRTAIGVGAAVAASATKIGLVLN